MAPEPTTEDVGQFCEFTGLDAVRDRSLVVSALKVRCPRPTSMSISAG